MRVMGKGYGYVYDQVGSVQGKGMDRDVYEALTQLDRVLPLAERQSALIPELVVMHRRILWTLAEQGRMPEPAELQPLLTQGDLLSALAMLAHEDLIVLNATGQPTGAYPMTLEPTRHRIQLHGHEIYAMCAIDALAIAPMFDTEVRIDSSCRMTGEAIRIHQRGKVLVSADPGRGIHTGVRWQSPDQCAAHSLCMEMVFLRDARTAADWAAKWEVPVSILNLEQSIEFGTTFFQALL